MPVQLHPACCMTYGPSVAPCHACVKPAHCYRWVQQHEQAERNGTAVTGPEADAMPGVRLLADDQTSKRLAKVGYGC